MYGLIGRFVAVAGRRGDLVAVLTATTGDLPGCRSYVVALDTGDPDAVWVTEVWDDEAAHRASLELPAVREAIAVATPLIARFDAHHVTEPVGGAGI